MIEETLDHTTEQVSQNTLVEALADKVLHNVCSKNCELLRREGLSRVGARAPVRVAASHCIVEVKVNKKI